MTIDELDKSVPTLINIFTEYLTSFYFLAIIGVVILISVIIHVSECDIRNQSPFNPKYLKDFLKEYWLVMLLCFTIFSTIAFIFNYTVTQTSWEETHLQTYFDEQETTVEENINLKEITLYEDNLNKGLAIMLVDGKLNKVEVNVFYEKELKEPKLTYVVLKEDVRFRSEKPLYNKGDLVNYTLFLPYDYEDIKIPLAFNDLDN